MVKVHIVTEDVIHLLSLADMDRLGIFYNNSKDKLIRNANKDSTTVTRFHEHPVPYWNPFLLCSFTENGPRQLHHRFGHPEVENFTTCWNVANWKTQTRRRVSCLKRHSLQSIRAVCTDSPNLILYSRKTGILTALFLYRCSKSTKISFLHNVCEFTRYQVARCLPTFLSEVEPWPLLVCWMYVYLDPFNVVTHDTGKQSMVRAF